MQEHLRDFEMIYHFIHNEVQIINEGISTYNLCYFLHVCYNKKSLFKNGKNNKRRQK